MKKAGVDGKAKKGRTDGGDTTMEGLGKEKGIPTHLKEP